METTEDRRTGLWMETAAERLLLLGFWVLVKKAEGSQGGAGAAPGPLCVSLLLRGTAGLEHPGVSEGAAGAAPGSDPTARPKMRGRGSCPCPTVPRSKGPLDVSVRRGQGQLWQGFGSSGCTSRRRLAGEVLEGAPGRVVR